MNPFNNKYIENIAFTALDYAFYIRHNISDMLIPFILEIDHSNNLKITRVVPIPDGDIEELIQKTLDKMKFTNHYFAICMEGRLDPEKGQGKQDAIFVKAFDRSNPKGFMLAQSFKGIEHNSHFRKIGNPVILDTNFPIPVSISSKIEDGSGNSFEPEFPESYTQVLVTPNKKNEQLIDCTIIIIPSSLSMTIPVILDIALNFIKKRGKTFSGLINLVTDASTITENPFKLFQLNQLSDDIYNFKKTTKSFKPISDWEIKHNRPFLIYLEDMNLPNEKKLVGTMFQDINSQIPSNITKKKNSKKPWWKFL